METSAFIRLGQVEDIADIVAFIASDAARWITGRIIEASGGSHLYRWEASPDPGPAEEARRPGSGPHIDTGPVDRANA
ncbi:SDR family oxidoreductase [Streptomyces sp. NPDC004012]